LFVFSCTVLFVSNSQVIGCEDRLRNDLYCVGWGVKLYSNQTSLAKLFTQCYWSARQNCSLLLAVSCEGCQQGKVEFKTALCCDVLYDTIREAILTCAQKLTRVSLIYSTVPTTQKW